MDHREKRRGRPHPRWIPWPCCRDEHCRSSKECICPFRWHPIRISTTAIEEILGIPPSPSASEATLPECLPTSNGAPSLHRHPVHLFRRLVLQHRLHSHRHPRDSPPEDPLRVRRLFCFSRTHSHNRKNDHVPQHQNQNQHQNSRCPNCHRLRTHRRRNSRRRRHRRHPIRNTPLPPPSLRNRNGPGLVPRRRRCKRRSFAAVVAAAAWCETETMGTGRDAGLVLGRDPIPNSKGRFPKRRIRMPIRWIGWRFRGGCCVVCGCGCGSKRVVWGRQSSLSSSSSSFLLPLS
mmetsp:Transcript_27435/g.56934  ORF Transcript_27435/g.56934 Transcript_27435/m.56934 type:complete len:290 (+) Transcript_27435:187-1056(+)